MVSFFNRSGLMWLQQLQDRIPVTDSRVHQDTNKLVAALQFSADATLNAVRFASLVATRRQLWQWQADVCHKWRLASAPFKGGALFGESLDPFLIETKDKRKILPSASRKGSSHPAPYAKRSSFRGPDYSTSFCSSDYGSSGFRASDYGNSGFRAHGGYAYRQTVVRLIPERQAI